MSDVVVIAPSELAAGLRLAGIRVLPARTPADAAEQVRELRDRGDMFRRQPAGKNVLRVCTNISCMLRGAYDVLAAFEQKLGVKKGGTAGDSTIVDEECLPACCNAPAVVCGTKYFLDVKPDDVGKIVDELRANPRPEGEAT